MPLYDIQTPILGKISESKIGSVTTHSLQADTDPRFEIVQLVQLFVFFCTLIQITINNL